MFDIVSVVGAVGGGVGILTGIFSLVYLRRQTQLMAVQVDKEIEIKITRDLDAPESVIDNKLRTFLNKRLGDIRNQMRQEFGSRIQECDSRIQECDSRIDDIHRILADNHITDRRDIMEDTIRVLSDQKGAIEVVKESNSKVSALEYKMQALQQAIEDIRNGVGNQTMVRAQIRGIAEQLLRITEPQELGIAHIIPSPSTMNYSGILHTGEGQEE